MKQSNQQSGVVRAANNAATKVATWSAAKQSFAQRVMAAGSFKTTGSAGTRNTAKAIPQQTQKK
jgi:hypothetical protein